ncbi:MAG: type II toxin-antitoxin system PemK/MazF family toxin [Clostridia bacterium]|nr:type II toxin-antitoxin system PemK/MazF family toxin [Clostridia bacterium]
MIVQRNSSIKRSQVWLVAPDPTVGAEIQKTRPCVVVSHDLIGTLSVRVVVPITEWQERFAGKVWLVRLIPDRRNGLTKDCAADALQVRCVSEDRFMRLLGVLSTDDMSDISAALAIVLDISS